MGNENSKKQLSNYSKRNIRAFLSDEKLILEDFLRADVAHDAVDNTQQGDVAKKFIFRKDTEFIRVLTGDIKDLVSEDARFISIFVEDDDDENVCAQKICVNMSLTSSLSIILYDV